ncbi:MAG: sensor histidine kinase [Geminicoccaceae bacterium]
MDVANQKREAIIEADRPPLDAIDEHDRLSKLLDAYNQVLGLISGDADLTDCLGEIATIFGRLCDGADIVIAASDPQTREIIGIAGTASGSDIEAIVSTLTSCLQEDSVNYCQNLLDRACGKVIQCHPVDSHNGETLGTLMILRARTSLAIPDIDPRLLESLKCLTGYAIEATRGTQALLAANERFAALAKNVPGVVYQRVVRPNGDIGYTYISEAAQDLFGVSPEEILSNPQALFDCHGPEYYATFRERLLAASRVLKLWDVEATIIARDGTRKYTHAIARPHREADGSVVWNGVILDQTRIKEAELEAAAAGARTRDVIIESIPQAFALYDADDRLVTWNSRFLDLYPELGELIAQGTVYVDILRAEIELGIDPLPENATVQSRLYQRLAEHHLSDYVVERQLPNGRWILVNEHRTDDGGTVVLHTDITELKHREAALASSNRELEAFASIASHDLQEPLRKVEAFGDRLKRKYHDNLGDDGKMYIERMQSSVSRMRALINDLLNYSRVTTKGKPFGPVNLQQILQEVISDLEVRIEGVGGKVNVSALPTIDADPTQMRQLFQNLIANAMKFHRPDEPPVVEIRAAVQGPGETGARQRCRIEVQDNGIGFDMKYAERIFGIFQRLHTRADYEGTGVGLATCRKIAERHHGNISVQSEPSSGTTFMIDLPLHQPVTECKGGER